MGMAQLNNEQIVEILGPAIRQNPEFADKQLTPELLKDWARIVGGYRIPELEQAVIQWVGSSRYFPKPSQILEIVKRPKEKTKSVARTPDYDKERFHNDTLEILWRQVDVELAALGVDLGYPAPKNPLGGKTEFAFPLDEALQMTMTALGRWRERCPDKADREIKSMATVFASEAARRVS